MEPLQKIPSPPALKWREFRYAFMPFMVFAVALVFAVTLWRSRVAMPQMIGEVELLTGLVTSGEDGLVEELKVERFQKVIKGQEIAEVRTADPESIQVSLAAISTDLQVLQARMAQDQQRILQDYEQLRLSWLRERVSLATARVDLEFAKSELQRVTQLHSQKLVSEDQFDLARSVAQARQAEVDELGRLVEQIEGSLAKLAPADNDRFASSIGGSISEAIAAQEQKLKLSKKTVTLRAPITGVISQVHHVEGERIQQGDSVVTITSTEPQQIIGFIRQPITMKPKPGDVVEVRSRADRSQTGLAKVINVGSAIEAINRDLLPGDATTGLTGLPVLISIPAELQLIPGEIVDLALREPGL